MKISSQMYVLGRQRKRLPLRYRTSHDPEQECTVTNIEVCPCFYCNTGCSKETECETRFVLLPDRFCIYGVIRDE